MLLTLGISHKTAPIEIREKLAFSQENMISALQLVQQLPLQEVALLSTCNRTEFYFKSAEKEAFAPLIHWWQNYQGVSFDINPYLYSLNNEQAVKHVMRVASGLDSMVIGESQILGQLKVALKCATQIGTIGKQLSRLFQSSFSVAKKIRASTGICAHPISIAFAAATLSRQIFSDLSKATVLLIGAGENIERVLRHLLNQRIKRLIIVNRTLKPAQELAERYSAQACDLSGLIDGLKEADIVISSIGSTMPVITAALLQEALAPCKRRPIFMVDLGVPRNIDPKVTLNEDVYLYTIDDLQNIVEANLKNRYLAVAQAELLINQAANAYMHWMGVQQKMQSVLALRAKAEEIKVHTLKNALRQLEKGGDPKQIVTQSIHQLTQRLMHHPTVNLRKILLKEEKFIIAKELFNIE